MEKFFDVLAMQESSGLPEGDVKPGDDGNAIGPFQIWHHYWLDATQHDKSIGGTYQDCRRRDYSEKIVAAYMDRYCKYVANVEEMARIHNAGPKGYEKRKNSKYWVSFKKHMDRMFPTGIVKMVPIVRRQEGK